MDQVDIASRRRQSLSVERVIFSPRYIACFDALLAAVAPNPSRPSEELTAFWPMYGNAYAGGLLVLGRAVNRWGNDSWTCTQLANPEVREKALRLARAESQSESSCPMSWISDLWQPPKAEPYNTARSAFWRVTRAVVHGLEGRHVDENWRDWPSTIAWSNLMKVAPRRGGNPTGVLWRSQFEASVQLLQHELEELCPRRVLVLAGRTWFKGFADGLGLKILWRPGGLVEGTVADARCCWVIARHPQGKPEVRFVSDVLEAFRELGTN